MKRLLTVQDISCVGKCSLTVALPILSAMGIEACPLPTAVLSTHTAFEHYTFRDLTEEIPLIEEAWEKEDLRFDTITSGYLGSVRQIQYVREISRRFGKTQAGKAAAGSAAGASGSASGAGGSSSAAGADGGSLSAAGADGGAADHGGQGLCTAAPASGADGSGKALRIVDPAMADGGQLYKGFTMEFVEEMKGLCGEADVIVPNLTEGCLLTGMAYREDGDEDYWKELLVGLAGLGCRSVVLTGFSAGGGIGAISYSVDSGRFRSYVNERLPVQYHGTGDIFASVLAGALTLGRTLDEAVRLSVDFTLESMRATQRDPQRVFYGVNFEEAIPQLVDALRT